MYTIDIIILITILLPAVIGAFFGFVNIVFSILVWVLSLLIAIKFSAILVPLFESSVDIPVLRTVLAFVGLFVISFMLLTVASYLVIKLFDKTNLTNTDRILGLCCGMCCGIIIVQSVVFLAGFTTLSQQPWWQGSVTIKPFEKLSSLSARYLPEDLIIYHEYK